ncbi:MAG TPA: site-specific integrase [Flavisolibacter sp.]|jgi:integrase|nr:site-specific integrase [Flavisolibacter sp.]
MSVQLRKRKNGDGTTTLYLDIYHNGRRQYEFLKECKLIKPTTPTDRQDNNAKMKLAKQIKEKRSLELQSSDYDITPEHKTKIDFLHYYQDYINRYSKKDIRVVINSKQKFEDFIAIEGYKSITTKQVTESLINRFKEYLESTLNGESPSTYFSRFKKVLKQATRDKIFKSNPAADVSIKRKETVKKDVLTFEEIQKLLETPLTAYEVKRAFLICCYTGIRYVDAIAMKWKNIDLQNKRLSFTQAKTGHRVVLQLHPTVIALLGEPQSASDPVFYLPSHTACLKNLRYWLKKAGINKHITWHCARHSFATNLIFFGADVNTASSLLGHTSLRYTQLYTRVVDSLKQQAISNLPEMKI